MAMQQRPETGTETEKRRRELQRLDRRVARVTRLAVKVVDGADRANGVLSRLLLTASSGVVSVREYSSIT